MTLTPERADGADTSLSFAEQLKQLAGEAQELGVMIVDHGSRRAESNELLNEVVAMFKQSSGLDRVAAAHMELAEPSITTAYGQLVADGAQLVIVFPYFLSPGRHWHADIPNLVKEAATHHPGVRWLVTSPLGLHPAMAGIMQDRLLQCLNHANGDRADCQLCAGSESCQLRVG